MADASENRSPWIAGPVYDCVLFIFAPLLAFALGAGVKVTGLADYKVTLWGLTSMPAPVLFVGSFTAAHLVIVVVRSHLNQEVFQQHKLRFTLAPLLLFALVFLSTQALVAVAIVSIWWDVYHSSLQTFGLGRIYDQRQGNDPEVGRRLDWWLNLLLYTGPILAGASLLPHLLASTSYARQISLAFEHVPAWAEAHQAPVTWVFAVGGAAFLIGYLVAYRRLAKAGYRVGWQKVALLVSTGGCSIFAWGFNAFGEAFFIMNVFHALQYFGIVWWAEKKTLIRVLRLEGAPGATLLALSALVWTAGLYGVLTKTLAEHNRLLLSVALVISIMHFWYDGFVWSVRRRMVP